jgi:hypothetical protein
MVKSGSASVSEPLSWSSTKMSSGRTLRHQPFNRQITMTVLIHGDDARRRERLMTEEEIAAAIPIRSGFLVTTAML